MIFSVTLYVTITSPAQHFVTQSSLVIGLDHVLVKID